MTSIILSIIKSILAGDAKKHNVSTPGTESKKMQDCVIFCNRSSFKNREIKFHQSLTFSVTVLDFRALKRRGTQKNNFLSHLFKFSCCVPLNFCGTNVKRSVSQTVLTTSNIFSRTKEILDEFLEHQIYQYQPAKNIFV